MEFVENHPLRMDLYKVSFWVKLVREEVYLFFIKENYYNTKNILRSYFIIFVSKPK